MEDSDSMLKFKKISDYPNYSLYVMVGGILKTFGGFSKRMIYDTEEEAREYLRKKRYLASQSGRSNQLAETPVLLVRYDAPYDSKMIAII